MDREERRSSAGEEEERMPTNVSSSSDETSTDEEGDVGRQAVAAAFSRLFAPYRTIGEVTGGCPFHFIAHNNSSSSMLVMPLENRFQIVRVDRLQPILVSQGLPGQRLSHITADATLSVTIVAHGPASGSGSTHVSLFYRTKPLVTFRVCRDRWEVTDLLHLGRNKVHNEAAGREENAAVIAVVLAKSATHRDERVNVVGDDANDSVDSGQEDRDDANDGYLGQVVLLVAQRGSMYVHKRIRLSTLPTLVPTVALHPSTYVNKILLAGTDQERAALCLVNVRSGKVIHSFKCLPFGSTSVTALEQSPALDTVAVGTGQGKVHLVNLRHDKCLFTLSHRSRDNNTTVRIQSLSFRTDGSAMKYGISPLAVGRSDGSVTVWDLTPSDQGGRRQILCEMDRIHPGGISKLMYLPQEPLLVSTGLASNSVLLHIFDSPDHSARLLRQRKGHTAPPRVIRYLHPGAGAGGGVLANMSDGTDAAACQILSAGARDRTLRVFSTARTVLDKEYSQGEGLEKRARKLGMESTAQLLLPPVVSMATSESRSRDWGDLVTIHNDHSFAYVWSSRRGAQSGPVLRQPSWNISAMKVQPPTSTHATSVAMSSCGNFCIVGTQGGTIYKYNVQSGNARGSYPRDGTDEVDGSGSRKPKRAGDIYRTMKVLEKKMKLGGRASNLDKQEADAATQEKLEQSLQAKLSVASHTGYAVTGVAVDSLNRTLLSVATDAKLILWNFASHAPHKKSPYTLPCPATMMCHVRDSDMAAIALDDFSVVLFDCSALSIVRRFGTGEASRRHTGRISDLAFSPDGRSLFTASMDGTVRVWDVPTHTCVDWLSFTSPPTSLTVSPTGEFVATTHTEKLGISLWSDRSFYQTVNIDGSPLLRPTEMDDPVPIADAVDDPNEGSGKADSANIRITDPNVDETDESTLPVVPKQKGLVTLSGLPPAHWKNLFHLELIKERNKPKEPPSKPPSAPFFLQWRPGEKVQPESSDKPESEVKQDDEEWAAAWSDDNEDEESSTSTDALERPSVERDSEIETMESSKKRRKLHSRSHISTLLERCSRKSTSSGGRYQEVTEYMSSLGPSAIDVALSSLCSGGHDLEEGLPLLQLACDWLVEASASKERFECVNAYVHRFLYLHAATLVEGQADGEVLRRVKELRQVQACPVLNDKMQQVLCHLSLFSSHI